MRAPHLLVSSNNDPHKLYEQGERIFCIRKPIVAAVQGAAIGGGLGLAMAADFRIATPRSRLSANFVKLGTHPGFALTYTLQRTVGHQTAALVLYTGRRFGGKQCVDLGLADELVDEDQLRIRAIALATEIAENAPLAVEATRETLRADLVVDIKTRTLLKADKQVRLKATADFKEGVRAVAERRPGNWLRR
ncbi:MAG: enoyl-CoA hydratase/isomerase family protein [Chloroflexota bacterium]